MYQPSWVANSSEQWMVVAYLSKAPDYIVHSWWEEQSPKQQKENVSDSKSRVLRKCRSNKSEGDAEEKPVETIDKYLGERHDWIYSRQNVYQLRALKVSR